MPKIKNKIKVVDSLPVESNKKNYLKTILIALSFIIILSLIVFIVYRKFSPYINAIDVKEISGKKIFITECNTKDYIIISEDKSYTLQLTDENCNILNFEGNIVIKNNIIFFDKNLTGTIDKDYNIIINDNIFKNDF